MIRRIFVAAASLLVASPTFAATQTILAGNVIADPAAGISGPMVIVVKDGRIVEMYPETAPSVVDDTEIIDLGGKTVLPGLIDLHVHLTSDPGGDYRDEAVEPDEWGVVVGEKNALLTARAGFTTVREAGSAQYTAFALRRGTAEGLIPGPRIVAAGPALSIVGGHGDVTGFRDDVLRALDGGYTCTKWVPM
jgi:imidazolonepropionase-like amidohydrolase